MRLGLGPPALHFSMLPLSSVISKLIHTCGLPQSNCVTVPFTLVRLSMSYPCHAWCAKADAQSAKTHNTKLPMNVALVVMTTPPQCSSSTFDAVLKRWVAEFLDSR